MSEAAAPAFRHQIITAGGLRFHVAECGEGDRLALPTSNGAGWDEPVAPVARAPLPRPDRAEWPPPARVDDPAANSVSPAGGEAAGRLDR